tara:strand:- start:122 stop:766 length:645 start_codon:yes stop_codon:yes gene_type:complete
MRKEMLEKLHKLASQNAFNEKETTEFIELVKCGTSIDEAIDIVEEGVSENKSVEEGTTIDKFNEEIKSIDTQNEGALPTEQPTEQPTKQADGVRAALDLLDEMAREFDNPAFEEIRKHLKRRFRKKRKKAAESFNDGNPPHKRIYNMVANLSGDWLECGEHHMYRGVLNPMGIGGDLLKIFDTIQDKLVLIGASDKELAQEQKRAVRENIKAVG